MSFIVLLTTAIMVVQMVSPELFHLESQKSRKKQKQKNSKKKSKNFSKKKLLKPWMYLNIEKILMISMEWNI
jgi:hypothetical protein